MIKHTMDNVQLKEIVSEKLHLPFTLPSIFSKQTLETPPSAVFAKAIYELRTGAFVRYSVSLQKFIFIRKRNNNDETSSETWIEDENITHNEWCNIKMYNDELKFIIDDSFDTTDIKEGNELDIIRMYIPEGERLHCIYERPDIERLKVLCIRPELVKNGQTIIYGFRPIASNEKASILFRDKEKAFDYLMKEMGIELISYQINGELNETYSKNT